jgi:phosphoribosylformylglycinamidine (FGAM) synthase-like enzyme
MRLQVLKLPSVGSKRFLTNKVDRSVSGLVAQQQYGPHLSIHCVRFIGYGGSF